MKRIIKPFLLASALFLTTTGFAQKKFTEGTIVYAVETNREELGMMAQMIPNQVVVKVKGDQVRTEQESSMMSNINLYNGTTKKSTVLMDVMGNKYALEADEKQMQEQIEKAPAFEVKTSDETKEIAGYKCKKATLVNKETSEEMVIFYTESIPNFSGNDAMSTVTGLSNIKGFPMEYSINMQGVDMKLTVKTITAEKLSDDLFKVPADYKKTTVEELQKEFGGGQ